MKSFYFLSVFIFSLAALGQSTVNPQGPPPSLSSIDGTAVPDPATDFLGDQPWPHSILWQDKATFIQNLKTQGKFPTSVSKTVDTFVVGGGFGGLYAAFELAKQGKSVYLTDQSKIFGGNSKALDSEGTLYQNGASYFDKPLPNSSIEKFLEELGLNDSYQIHFMADDPVFIDGVRYDKPFINGTNPKNKAQFNKLDQFFKDMYGNKKSLIYPDIPSKTKKMKSYVDKLNKMKMIDYLEKIVLKEPLDPDVKGVISGYFQSANGMALDLDAIAAGKGLNFLVGDYVAGMANFPAGNAAFTDAVYKKLGPLVPGENLKTQTLTFDVNVVADGVEITSIDFSGNVTLIKAKNVVFAAPLFLAPKVVNGMPDSQVQAIGAQKTRPYLVGTAVVNEELVAPGQKPFDVYFWKRSTLGLSDPKARTQAQGITDVVFTYAQGKTIIQGYWPLFYSGARQDLLPDGSFANFKTQFHNQLLGEILPMYKLSPANLVNEQVTRYAHAIPLSLVDMTGSLDQAVAAVGGRVHFVGQGKTGLPGFESIFSDVNTVVASIIADPDGKQTPVESEIPAQAKQEEKATSVTTSGVCPYLAGKVSTAGK